MNDTFHPQHFATSFFQVVLITFSVSAFSEPYETMLTETDILSEIPIVTSASRMAQPLNQAPSSITIIDRELIRKSGAQTWVDIFRLVPGFQSYYVSGSRQAISSHGLGAEFPNHLEVMVDGRSVYEPIFSTVGWSNIGIELHDIDRIEITRGSNAAAFGSNAFQGAVNIITVNPTQSKGSTAHLTIGSKDTQTLRLANSDALGAVSYRASLSFNHNDGFPSVSGRADPGDNGALQDSRDLAALNVRGIYTPNLQDTLDVHVGFSHENTGWGDADHPQEFIAADFYANFESLKWSREIDSDDSIKVHLYHNAYRGKNDFAPLASTLLSESLGIPISPNDLPVLAEMLFGVTGVEDQPLQLGFGSLRSDRYDVEFEHQTAFTPPVRLTWGAGFRHESIAGAALLNRERKRKTNSRRLFAHGEWRPISRTAINAGFMMEDNDIVNTTLSARFGANFHITPNQTLRTTIARGTRSPSLLEAYEFQMDRLGPLIIDAIRISDPALSEEKLTSYELGYIANLPDYNLRMDVRFFQEKLRNTMRGFRVNAAPFIPGPSLDDIVRLRTNSEGLNIDRAEAQVDYLFSPALSTRLSYAYLDCDNATRLNEGNSGDLGKRIPKHSVSALLSYQVTSALSVSANAYHMSEVRWDEGDFIDDFTRVDLQLSYRFSPAQNYNGRVELIVQNLGEAYPEFNHNNIFGTRYFLNLSLALP